MAKQGAKLDWPTRYQQLLAQSKQPLIQAFYESAICDLNTPISDVPLVALDFETTGLNYQNDDKIGRAHV